MPTRLIATSLALTAFAAAVLTGLVAENPATTVLWRALVAMVGCYFAGLLIGSIAERALQDHIDRYKQAHPIDSADDETAGTDSDAPASSSSSQAPSEQPQSSASAATDRTTSSTSSQAAA